jgi:Undecaprenyl-phosphate glucose phosphotransferase
MRFAVNQSGRATQASSTATFAGLPSGETQSLVPSSFLNARTLPLMAISTEYVIVSLAIFGAGAAYHHLAFGYMPSTGYYLLATMLLTALFVVPCGLGRDYSLKRLLMPKEQLRSVFFHWNTAYSLFVFVLFLSYATDFYSRGSIVAQYVAGLVTVLTVRGLTTQIVARGLRKGSLGGKRVVVVGEAATASEITRRLKRGAQGVDIVSVVKIPVGPQGHVAPASQRTETQAALAAVEEIGRKTEIDDIIIGLPWTESGRIRTFVENLAVVPATIHLASDTTSVWAQSPVLARVGTLPTIRLSRAPLTLKDRIFKRAFDLVVAGLLLVLLSPLFLAIALAIKTTSRGPVLFRQRRHGFNQSEFRIFKFRTMTTLDDGPIIRQATRDDKRITGVGRFLRAKNLDELPQLLNVLAGQMSLVGPRPHAVAHNNEFEEKIRLYARRHNVKPGITGWSQVNGLRGETDTIEKMRQRVEHDLHYIDNWSLFFDIKIMLLTVFSRESYRNAY